MESEEAQILSIDSQIKEMMILAEREKLEIVDVKKESHSAKEAGQRPVFNEIVDGIKQGKFNGILTWAADRISRNAGDLGRIVDLMDQKLLVDIRTFSQRFSNNPNEKFLLMILGSQAKLENDNKVLNVKRGLRARCEMGLWPCTAPTGYLNSTTKAEKCQVKVDPHRAPIIKKMFEKIAYENISGRQAHNWLMQIKFKTRNGKLFNLSNVYLALRNTFYYGSFEYPKGGGQWYQGKHEPIITRELFDLVQERINEHLITKVENKEFAFTRMMTCALCGSGITASEMYKKQKNGNIHHYIHYHCSKFKDKNCKCGYLREEDLIEQLTKLIDTIDLDEIGMKERIKTEVERHKKFQTAMLGEKASKIRVDDIDIRNYAKYLLRDGAIWEKREVLSCLKSKVVMKEKKISIQK
jgi:DNA invertase Pin-like site-specific DNA recombinase